MNLDIYAASLAFLSEKAIGLLPKPNGDANDDAAFFIDDYCKVLIVFGDGTILALH